MERAGCLRASQVISWLWVMRCFYIYVLRRYSKVKSCAMLRKIVIF